MRKDPLRAQNCLIWGSLITDTRRGALAGDLFGGKSAALPSAASRWLRNLCCDKGQHWCKITQGGVQTPLLGASKTRLGTAPNMLLGSQSGLD